MTIIKGDSRPGVRPTPTVIAVNDYSKNELANAEVAVGFDNAAGTAVPLSLVTTNEKFDANAQAQYVAQMVEYLLEHPESVPRNGLLVLGSTDQRKDDGGIERFANQGAPLFVAYIPEIDTLVAMANAADCWAPTAEILARRNVGIHEVTTNTKTQFRGAKFYPQETLRIWEAIHDPANHRNVELDRSLNSIRNSDSSQWFRPAASTLATNAKQIRSANSHGVTEFVSAPPVNSFDSVVSRAYLIADYVANPAALSVASDRIFADVVPVSIAQADYVDAGFIAAQLSLNAKVPSLYVVDSSHHEHSAIYAASLPNGSLVVGPAEYGVWENLGDAGVTIQRVRPEVATNQSITSVANELWVADSVQAKLVPGAVLVAAPGVDEIQHVDNFGQGKFRASHGVASAVAEAAKNPRTPKLLVAEANGHAHVARATSGIFGLVTGEFGIAEGSSGWNRLNGTRVVFHETVVRDQASTDKFALPRDPYTGRARSGGTMKIDLAGPEITHSSVFASDGSLTVDPISSSATGLTGAAAPSAFGR